jgi:pimeloyl-ACP methyl ester carboxylesterase
MPTDVRWSTVAIEAEGGREMEVALAVPASGPALGGVLIAPGLHFGGAEEARMKRFISILAHGGLAVCAPDIPDYVDQVLRPSAPRDLGRALEHFLGLGILPEGSAPAIFTISFGSWIGLEVACDPAFADRIGGVVTFGGFADWRESLRFCVGLSYADDPNRARDPLNRPVCFMNIYDDLPEAPSEPAQKEALFGAWRAFMEATWGREEMKTRGRHMAVAQALAEDVSPDLRELFLQGCASAPGGEALAKAALEAGDRRLWLDPRPKLAGLKSPISLVHGMDDDVIPFEEMAALARALPAEADVRTYGTGLYGHSERGGLRALLSLLPSAVQEGRTMMAMLGDLIRYAGVNGS